MVAIIVHGGCGKADPEESKERQIIIENAMLAGKKLLLDGKSALEAVEAAVIVLEDAPQFNAGTGSCLTLDGEVEMDASVMDSDGRFGAVGSVKKIRNPVILARLVMEKTDHIFMVGEGAIRLARILGLPEYDPVTPQRKEKWEKLYNKLIKGEKVDIRFWQKISSWVKLYAQENPRYSTVGAVALDRQGKLAAATSTGGIWFKMPGRIGDSPILGAGTYASQIGAASATGYGEGIIKTSLTRLAVDKMQTMACKDAVQEAIDILSKQKFEGGLIGIDSKGRVSSAHNAEAMPVASWQESP